MKLHEIWQAFISVLRRENPFTPKFTLWYIITIVIAAVIVVASLVLPMIQETKDLNKKIQAGQVYIQDQNPILTPDINDFILESDGTFQLEKLYPTRSPQKHWEPMELKEYWDNIDQKKLKDMRRENRDMLRQQLQDLP